MVWIVQLSVRVSNVKDTLLPSKSGCVVAIKRYGVRGLMKNATKAGVSIPNALSDG